MMHQAEADATREPLARAHALYRSAKILYHQLDDTERSLAQLKLALAASPQFIHASELLELIYRESGAVQQLAAHLRQRTDQCDDPDQRLPMLESMLATLTMPQENVEEAARVCLDILKIEPLHDRAVEHLPFLFRRMGQWHECFASSRRLVDRLEDPQEKARHLVDMGNISQYKLNDVGKAVSCFQEALELSASPKIFEDLGCLLDQQGEWDELVALYDKQLEQPLSELSKAMLYLKRALVNEYERHDFEKAQQDYRCALTHHPDIPWALDGLIRVSAQHQDEGLLKFEADAVKQLDAPRQRNARLVLLALNLTPYDRKTSCELLRTVCDEAPASSGCQSLYFQLLAGDNAWDDLVERVEGTDALIIAGFGVRDRRRALQKAIASARLAESAILAYRLLDHFYAADGDDAGHVESLQKRCELEASPQRKRAVRLRLASRRGG